MRLLSVTAVTDKKAGAGCSGVFKPEACGRIISMPVDAEGNHLKKFQKTGKPIVLIDRRIRELSCDSVLVDNEKAAEDAMRDFFQAGHRKIGIIGGPEGKFPPLRNVSRGTAMHTKKKIYRYGNL